MDIINPGGRGQAEREVNRLTGALHDLLMSIMRNSRMAKRPTVITVASFDDTRDGLWLLHHPDHDKAALAKRLRLAADTIEAAARPAGPLVS